MCECDVKIGKARTDAKAILGILALSLSCFCSYLPVNEHERVFRGNILLNEEFVQTKKEIEKRQHVTIKQEEKTKIKLTISLTKQHFVTEN